MASLPPGFERGLVLLVVIATLAGQALVTLGGLPADSNIVQDGGHAPHEGGVPGRCSLPDPQCGCDGCRAYFQAHSTAIPETLQSLALPVQAAPRHSAGFSLTEARLPPPLPPPRPFPRP